MIYTSYRAAFDRTSAAVLSLVLVLLALLFVVLERAMRSRHQQWRVGSGAARRAERVPLGPWRWPALLGVVGLFGLAVGFPMVVLVRLMVQSQRFEADPGSWLAATGNTVQAAGIGAVFAMLLALPIGVLAARHTDRVAKGVESAAFVSHALPGLWSGCPLCISA